MYAAKSTSRNVNDIAISLKGLMSITMQSKARYARLKTIRTFEALLRFLPVYPKMKRTQKLSIMLIAMK